MTSDGFATIVSTDTLQLSFKPKKCHNMPLTSCAFLVDKGSLVTASTDYSYMFSRFSDFSVQKSLLALLTQAGLLIVLLLVIADYLY
jgi:hypothetical protein